MVVNKTIITVTMTIAGTVEVHTDGVPLFVGWAYDPALNAVVFSPERIPGDDILIEVFYEVLAPCGD